VRANCPSRVNLGTPARKANALNIEVGQPLPRCMEKPPEHWGPNAPSVLRWIGSGGNLLVLGHCDANCPRGIADA
jgi:hypothetical protein